MKIFNNLSIKSKLIAIISFISFILVATAITLDIISENKQIKETMNIEYQLVAHLIGGFSEYDLLFLDQSESQKTLGKLKNIQNVKYACIYDTNGDIFSEYGEIADEVKITFTSDSFVEFTENTLHLFQPIFDENRKIGTIYLQVSTEMYHSLSYAHLLEMLWVGFVIFIIAIILAYKLQKIITIPILSLTNMVKKFSKNNDFSLYFEKQGDDEVGVLGDGINNMLSQIRERENERNEAQDSLKKSNEMLLQEIEGRKVVENELSKHRDNLEEVVNNRTLELAKTNKQLNDTLESLSHPFYVVDINTYEVVLANSAAKKNNFTKGITCYQLRHNRNEPCSDIDTPCPIQMIKEKRTAVSVEHIHCNAEGEPRNVEVMGYPILDAQGNITNIIEYSIDITERKQTEEKFKMLATAVQQSVDGIAIANLEGIIQFVNPSWAEMHGFETTELLGAHLSIFHTKEQLENDVGPFNEVVIKEGKNQGEVGHVTKDGTTFPTMMTVTVLKDTTGSPTGLAAIVRDITESKKLEIQFQQSQKMEAIGTLAAGIAHEINTPMHFINDNTNFFERSIEEISGLIEKYRQLFNAVQKESVTPELIADIENATQEADLEFILEEIPLAVSQSLEGIKRVTSIVRAMKDFSHPGHEKKNATDINKTIQSTIVVARNEWKYVSELITDFDPNLVFTPIFVGDFNQVILNIIVNAAHAIGDIVNDQGGKGTITVKTQMVGDWTEIRIKDTGKGIPKEIISKVFDPFFTTKNIGKGTGQGLSIAHSVIVDKHGGTIDIETELGKGTTFIIRLPVILDESLEESYAE